MILGELIGSSFEQTWIPFTQGCFVPSLVKIGSVVLEKKIFKFRQCIFAICVIISPWKRAGPFIWTNLNPHHPRMLCVKFGWNWLSGSGEEDFWISSMYFRHFLIISPWKRPGSHMWTTLNPLYPRMLCAILVEIGPVVVKNNLKMWKVYDDDDNDWQILIRKLTWAFGSGKLKVSICL